MTLDENFKARKVNKGNPLEYRHFEDFLYRLRLPMDSPEKLSERSWFMTKEEAEGKQFDLKAVNSNAPDFSDKRTAAELYRIIAESQQAISEQLAMLVN